MTAFGVSLARVGHSEAGRRIHAAGVAYQRQNAEHASREAAEEAKRAHETNLVRLAAEAGRQRAEEERRWAAAIEAVASKVRASLAGRGEAPILAVADIVEATAVHFKLSRRDLLGHRRFRNVAHPRQVAMYLAMELTERSLPEIGRSIGGRDHTTILWGARRIASAMELGNAKLIEDVTAIKRVLFG